MSVEYTSLGNAGTGITGLGLTAGAALTPVSLPSAVLSSPAFAWAGIAVDTLQTVGGIIGGIQRMKAAKGQLELQRHNIDAQVKMKEMDVQIWKMHLGLEAARHGTAANKAAGQSKNVGTGDMAKTLAIGGGALAAYLAFAK